VPNCGTPELFLRPRLKKNLFSDLLAIDVVQEIETLVGRQAVADVDFEALEVALRQQVLQLAGKAVEQRFNADLPMKSVPGSVVLAEVKRVMPGVAASRSRVYSVRCDSIAPTITAPHAGTATVLGTFLSCTP
jgi:hypothetical protein